MKNVTRAQALGAIASTVATAACSGGTGSTIAVGSKNFTESFVIAEIYAKTLEAAGFRVARKFNLGSTQVAMAAMQRGDIDLYPEYTGTALVDVLHLPPMRDPTEIYRTVARAFAGQYGIVWLTPSPMNDSQGLVTTGAISVKYGLNTLSQLAIAAPKLRLASIQEFLARPDGLPGLQKFYGGFKFADVRTYDIALKYQALISGKADVASAFTTDGAIANDALVVLEDDKHFWPPYNVAPIVRAATLREQPTIAALLNAISPHITTAVAQKMNAEVESGHQDPGDVAAAFLKTISGAGAH